MRSLKLALALGAALIVLACPAVAQTPGIGGFAGLVLNGLTNTAVAIKPSAGQVGKVYCYNPNSSVAYIQLFNALAGSVTVGTTAPLHSYGIPPTSASGYAISLTGDQFSSAISAAATTTAKGGSPPPTPMDCDVSFY